MGLEFKVINTENTEKKELDHGGVDLPQAGGLGLGLDRNAFLGLRHVFS